MAPYILTLLVASLAAAVVELLAPRGEGGRLAGHVRMIAGLFLLVALLDPLQKGIELLQSAADGELTEDILSALPDDTPIDYESTFHAGLSAVGARETEAWVSSTLASSFSVPATDAIVAAVCETVDGGLIITEVRIALSGSSLLTNPHPIETYFEEQLGCPCYVTVSLDSPQA